MCGRVSAAAILFACALSGGVSADEREDFFEAKIRPLLVGTCFRCHGDQKTGGELRIDSREALVKGGETGAAIVPGKPEESLLIAAVERRDDVSAMPPELDKALRKEQIADLATWIKHGAVWPAGGKKFETTKQWAFEPVRDPPPPQVVDQAWLKNAIDAFIRARQESVGIQPAAPADKVALLRRATYDLTGLPPTPAEIEAFVKDDSPRAFAIVVDRLLASPAYGEHWGRHWLDVVRYADTAGETADFPAPHAWKYRNYIIDALNADKPYDEFLREQIAGDILAENGPPGKYAERVTATGYLAISRRFGFDSENYHHLTIQDTLDTLGQSVLGLSLGCARCHDHKFDALTMRDYYGLYGIFDSSRYAFPGSEQKQKVRSLLPLVPAGESQAKWREYQTRLTTLTKTLADAKQPVPTAVLRSLHDLDGDFELQAPAAGGSNGVLVPPWQYRGKVAVTNAAQSPFQNVYPAGKVGASVPADAGAYCIEQSLLPRRTRGVFHVNVDFRLAPPDAERRGRHRLSLGAFHAAPAIEVLLAADGVFVKVGEKTERLGDSQPGAWRNLQLTIDLDRKTVTAKVGVPGGVQELPALALGDTTALDRLAFESVDAAEVKSPQVEYDNVSVQDPPLAAVSTEPPTSAAKPTDLAALNAELNTLAGIDGDFELQSADSAPAAPWGPGPNSVVKLAAGSQSAFRNLFPAGAVGIHMPNRAEYDGFGQTLANVKPDADGRLFVGFDFRCASAANGGDGSWRYYLGHGPGKSAAVELFMNGAEFYRRSGDNRDAMTPLAIGEWYQVRLALDLKAKKYHGRLLGKDGENPFEGEFAAGWDGTIDYTFIDSYGHRPGVRPALDADNFYLADREPTEPAPTDAERKSRVAELRKQITASSADVEAAKRELNELLVNGPFAMAYGVSEGTPHNVRIQLRGEPDQPGQEVPRGFIKILDGETLPSGAIGSGRLELAQRLTRADHPLTSRVMINRVWQYHFGRGLVKTPNDFGVRGQAPTHPELLDYLATRFVQSGWSLKAMHRLIMLSATYQQSSHAAAMPENINPTELYAAFPRRRLSAEEIRDSLLALSGDLDRTPGREHPFPTPTSWGYTQHAPFSAVYEHSRRSVYLMTQRLKRHPFLALFDGPDPNATTADRLTTTVPTQALFFLNDPFVHAKAEAWAQRLFAAAPDEPARIDAAHRAALGRGANAAERQEATEFLDAYRGELGAGADAERKAFAAYLRTLFAGNEFLYVD